MGVKNRISRKIYKLGHVIFPRNFFLFVTSIFNQAGKVHLIQLPQLNEKGRQTELYILY
jgi:hypothetical protein